MINSRFPIPSVSMLLVLSIYAFAAEEEENRFVSESHGFSIERPDASWVFHESASASDGSFTLDMVPDPLDNTMKASVIVTPVTGATNPKVVRDAVLKSIEGDEQYTVVELFDSKISDVDSSGFCIDTSLGDVTLRVRQCYMIRDGMQYTLLFFAPLAGFNERIEVLEKVWNSFAFLQVSEAMKSEQKILALAALCGSEIDWVKSWDEASARAKKENKLILIQARFYPGFTIADETRFGPFMDPDIVGLVQERFIAFHFEKGMDAPFVSQQSYGMSSTTFGSSLLLATAEGEIVGDTCCIESATLHDFLIHHLASMPPAAAPPPQGFDKHDRARWHMRRGEYDDAMKILESASSARGHALKASLLRRMRKGEAALDEIEKAKALAEEEELAGIVTDEAVLRLKMNDIEQAAALFDRLSESDPPGARHLEALYWLGACKLRLTGDKAAAEALWKRIIETDDRNRWAWKASAALKSTAFMMGDAERLDWPPEVVIASNRVPAPEKLDVTQVDQAEADAVEFLLRHQRDNGSWICPTAAMGPTDEEQDQFTQAITAICGQSLVAYSDREDATSAAMRAIDYLLKVRNDEKKTDAESYYMDYVFWKRCYVLWFFSDCVQAGLVPIDRLEAEMTELVAELGRAQMTGGGWSYLLTTDLGAPEEKPQLSMSFVTAVLVMSLIDAKAADVPVPDEIIENGLTCLERMKNPDGTFEYMINHATENAPRNTPPEGAAGRGPLCNLALYYGGRCDTDAIHQALDLFAQHRAYYAKEHGKTLMHAGPHAQGSHYLMFDYAYAAEAIRQLPEDERDIYRSWLLDQILSVRTVEGSFVDNPLLGWHYGTAMALMAFQHLGATF